ncbi:MAG: NAD-dependent deacetylase [Actinobacteria bacterium]|nr:NAD-dependent deacetylase [Actinomycetota bacterium]
MASEHTSSITAAAAWLRAARRVTVLTGAGISTDSGIPDFRGPNGLWTKNPQAQKAANLQHYLDSVEVRRFAWQNRLHSAAWAAQPNPGHRALVEIERRGQLLRLVTQNIDELHQRAGHAPELVLEVHGTMHRSVCWTCGDRRPMTETLERVRTGEDDPDCLLCRERGVTGVLKSDTISFGQSLVAEVIHAAMQAAQETDLLIAVGSSLQVYPVANMVPRARAAGARIIVVNGEPTKMDHHADAVLIGSISEVLTELVGT